MEHNTIYETMNLVNGKIYIGKHETDDPEDDYLGSGKLIKAAIKKYGPENFKKRVLFDFKTVEEMNAKEAEIVTPEFCARDDNYNLCPGGQGGFSYINTLPERSEWTRAGGRAVAEKNFLNLTGDSKARQEEGRKLAIQRSADVRRGKPQKSIESWRGKKHTDEAKRAISQNQSGSKNSQTGSMWITDGASNKKIRAGDIIPEGWIKGRKLVR